MEFKEYTPFGKDFKRINRKQRSLPDDLSILKRALETDGMATRSVKNIPLGKWHKGKSDFYKVREFRCKSLGKGSRSGLRLIFHYDSTTDIVTFIEMYTKSNQTNHSEGRIKDFVKLVLKISLGS